MLGESWAEPPENPPSGVFGHIYGHASACQAFIRPLIFLSEEGGLFVKAISGTKCNLTPPPQGPIGANTWQSGRTNCGVIQVCACPVVGLMEGVTSDVIGRDKGERKVHNCYY